jgi:hypothetical protein
MIAKLVERWQCDEGHEMTTVLEWDPFKPFMVELVDTNTFTGEQWRHGMSRPRLVECLAKNLGITSVPQVEDAEMFAYIELGHKRVRFITRPHRADRQNFRVLLADVRDLLDTADGIVSVDAETERVLWKRQEGRWRWIPDHAGCDIGCPCKGANTP